jgi:hypothetical protein
MMESRAVSSRLGDQCLRHCAVYKLAFETNRRAPAGSINHSNKNVQLCQSDLKLS